MSNGMSVSKRPGSDVGNSLLSSCDSHNLVCYSPADGDWVYVDLRCKPWFLMSSGCC